MWHEPTARARRILFVSNGHGEDSIAARIIGDLRLRAAATSLEVIAWPMVGAGDAYRRAGVTTTGARNELPSEGFATLSLRLLWRDLRAGWLATHWRQLRSARAMRGRFDIAVAVGDVVPMAAAALADVPFLFVGCAKSAYYGARFGYTALERHLLRTRCRCAFPRDQRTAEVLAAAGVPVRYAGNPMMDGLEGSASGWDLSGDPLVIACLPGSRRDAGANCTRLLTMAAAIARLHAATEARPAVFLFAIPESLGWAAIATAASGSTVWRPSAGRQPEGTLGAFEMEHGARALFLSGRFADVLRRSALVIGLAGTANEQAVGLGKPLVTFATAGTQGAAYLTMKMRFFGESAVELPADPEAFAAGVVALLQDPERQTRMARAGRERMGAPGATAIISQAIIDAAASGQ